MQFQSERLKFREYNESDFSLFYSVFSNELVMKYAFMDRCCCEEELLPYFREVLANNNSAKDRRAYEYAVFLNSDQSFIGFADIMMYQSNETGGCAEIGYFLLPEFWGKGYATEIASSMIAIGFKYLNLHRVEATCNSHNLRSEGVMKKTGMIKEGEARKVRFKNGRWDNELRYAILIEDWKEAGNLMKI